MPESIEEILEEYLELAKEIIRERGDVSPIVAFFVDGRVVEAVCGSRESIRRAIDLGNFLEAEWLVVVFTGWMKKFEKEEAKEKIEEYKYGDIARSPEKKEVLVGQIKSKDGKRISRILTIRREKGEVEFEEEYTKIDNFDGYLSV